MEQIYGDIEGFVVTDIRKEESESNLPALSLFQKDYPMRN